MSAATSVEPHRIGGPRLLSAEEIASRRRKLEREYGSLETLEGKRDALGLSWEERTALTKLESLRYLAGE